MIKHLMSDKIKLIKNNGKKIADIEALVQKNKIFVSSPVPFEETDTIEYVNPLGVEERFYIENVNPVKDGRGEFHHIEISYRKLSK